MNLRGIELLKHTKKDLFASIVVFLVALPLCLGIALASGAPLFSGLISGIIGGIVVGWLSKSSLSVSGPAAGLVVIVLSAVDTLGSYEAFLLAVFIAGIIQFVLGYLKAGIIGLYFPSSVIKGMLAAIGLILILKQIPHLLGFDANAFGEMEFLQADGSNTFSYLLSSFEHIYAGSLAAGILALGILILWESSYIKKHALLKQIPSGVLAVVSGVILNSLFRNFHANMVIDGAHLVSIPVISSLTAATEVFRFPDFSLSVLGNINLYITAITLAIVASLETLLSTQAIDKLDPHKRRTPQNAELKAQGIGNALCGLIGGLPVTAVIVRSSANLDAGARTKMSAVYHGILLLLAIVLFPTVMNKIPLASLAAVLVVVGYKLTKPSLYRHQYNLGRQQYIPFVVTIVAILFTDLLVGILIGMGIGAFYILRANYKVPYFYDEKIHQENNNHVIKLRLSEHVSFLNKASLQLTFEHLPAHSEVEIDGSLSRDIAHDALEVIYDFKNTAHEKDIKVSLKNIPEFETNAFH